jgi:hypothetical protein
MTVTPERVRVSVGWRMTVTYNRCGFCRFASGMVIVRNGSFTSETAWPLKKRTHHLDPEAEVVKKSR